MAKNQHTPKEVFFKFLWGMSVHQKLGIILENKVVQKLSLEKNGRLNWYSSMKFFFEKNRLIFDKIQIDFESTILAFFEALALCQFTKYSNFIWKQLIFEQKPCFLGPIKQETPWRNWHYYICTINSAVQCWEMRSCII